MLIGFAGRKRVGKDTAGEYLCERYGFKRVAFADPLKQVCAIMFGLTNEQLYGDLKETVDTRYNYTPRQILQKFGTDLIRERLGESLPLINGGDSTQFWIDCFKRQVDVEQCDAGQEDTPMCVTPMCVTPMCVTDVRFENEAQAIIDLGGTVVLIDRQCGESGDTHSSESVDIPDTLISYRIDNSGTIEQLYAQLERYLTIVNKN